MSSSAGFPPLWTVEEREEAFIVQDATGQPLGYFYFEDEPVRQRSTKRLSKDEAWRIAANVANAARPWKVNSRLLRHGCTQAACLLMRAA